MNTGITGMSIQKKWPFLFGLKNKAQRIQSFFPYVWQACKDPNGGNYCIQIKVILCSMRLSCSLHHHVSTQNDKHCQTKYVITFLYTKIHVEITVFLKMHYFQQSALFRRRTSSLGCYRLLLFMHQKDDSVYSPLLHHQRSIICINQGCK